MRKKTHAIPVLNPKIQIHGLKASAPTKVAVLLFLPFFWFWVFLKLLITSPDIIHACDLDTSIPALAYRLFNKRTIFVFDVFDRYGMGNIPKKSLILYKVVNLFEEIVAAKANLFITVSVSLFQTFKRFQIKRYIIIMNVPESKYVKKALSNLNNKHENTLRLYLSNLETSALIAYNAIKGLSNVKLIITGGLINNEVKKILLNSKQVEYYGIVRYEEVLRIESEADAFLILYDPSIELSNYRLSGNRFFEALSLGKVVITNIWDPFVYNTICPYLIVQYDEKSIRKTVETLLKKKIDTGLPSSGLSKFQSLKHCYCWEYEEKKLLVAYNNILHTVE